VGDPTIHNVLGAVNARIGQTDAALDCYDRALDIKPNFAEAAASYREAVKIKPDFAEAHCSLGIGLSEVGRFEEAIASFTLALQLRPDLAEANVNLSRIK
jgi:protein O-GlcNAc transferase